MNKKMTITLSGAFALSLLITGCGSTSGSSSSSSNGQVTLEFFQYKPEAGGTFNKLIKKFEQENPNIKVTQTNPPDAETVIKTRIAKNNLPDVIGIGGDSTYAEMAKDGLLADFTKSSELKNIEPAYLKLLHHVTGSQTDNAIPYAANADGVIYNKQIFKQLGITPPTTWDQFIADAQKIKAAGKTPFYFTFKDSWTTLPAFNGLAANLPGDSFFTDLKAGKTTFQKSYKDTADKFLQLLQYGQADEFGHGYNDGNVAFANGKSAMYLQGIWAIPEIKKANPNIQLGVFPLPASNDPSKNRLVSGVDLLLTMPKNEKHPAEAKKFIDFLLKQDSVKTYIAEQNAFSIEKGINQDNPDVAELNPVFAKGMVVDFADHNIPSAMHLDQLVQQFAQKKDVNAFLKSLDTEWNKAQSH
ncbi:extracellular solute-binding protein [Fodinisporobacter ferrooxydans]|uniref:Extracellular solute-binding protein n=1 Tax=Fodinisporobacter ferrooxydans TaxID=2901836 RepID=A0ABY4CH11_9BACL|nr:extracellular solute-binding protein [Alicyclobacillaceae bacterium MYW30-H2]